MGRPNANGPAMHFRVTVRDGYEAGGGVDTDDVTLKLDPRAGPFLVTSQKDKGTVVRGGSSRLVTWKVNGTRFLAENVRILLTTDGGKTWTSLAKTTNDGSAKVRFPDVNSRQGPDHGRGRGQLLLRGQRRLVQDRVGRSAG